jgi:hypothetical protein
VEFLFFHRIFKHITFALYSLFNAVGYISLRNICTFRSHSSFYQSWVLMHMLFDKRKTMIVRSNLIAFVLDMTLSCSLKTQIHIKKKAYETVVISSIVRFYLSVIIVSICHNDLLPLSCINMQKYFTILLSDCLSNSDCFADCWLDSFWSSQSKNSVFQIGLHVVEIHCTGVDRK